MGHTLCASFHRVGEDSLEKRNSLIPMEKQLWHGGSMHVCANSSVFAADTDRSCTITPCTGIFVQRTC